ncbi:MAG: hypothetical protein IKX21_04905, partial [Deltaproteobacteria bacterium]|nr:hypothetical protein [Deltaproteobacteria bacterium]
MRAAAGSGARKYICAAALSGRDETVLSKLSSATKVLLIMFYDALCVAVSGGLALLVRFDFSFNGIPKQYLTPWSLFLPLCIAITI